jgi:hypothetical protein
VTSGIVWIPDGKELPPDDDVSGNEGHGNYPASGASALRRRNGDAVHAPQRGDFGTMQRIREVAVPGDD